MEIKIFLLYKQLLNKKFSRFNNREENHFVTEFEGLVFHKNIQLI